MDDYFVKTEVLIDVLQFLDHSAKNDALFFTNALWIDAN
jgi:hypothetical protein